MRYARKSLDIDESTDVTALVGNPNVGKSVIFSYLTGKYRDVSNFPGTTVEVSIGEYKFEKDNVIIDTPGADSLTPISEDEKVTRDILLGTEPNKVIQVADAKNLKRALMLFLQLSEFDILVVLDLNMIDEAKSRLIDIDIEGLETELGVPITKTVATEGRGLRELKTKLKDAKTPKIDPEYPKEIEEALNELEKIFGNRGIALLYLAAPFEMIEFVRDRIGEEEEKKASNILSKLHQKFSQNLSYLITMAFRKKADQLYQKYAKQETIERTSMKEKLSDLTLNPITGIPIFLGALLLLYLFVGYVGAQYLVNILEGILFGEYINPFINDIIIDSLGDNIISTILVGKYGIITVGITWAIALILPIITTFFLAFSILEDCGYIPRLAAMADKSFRRIGLNGKAVLPLVLGFGCDTMATLTTRVLDSPKERTIATLMLALGIPCSAQLGVIFAIMATLPFVYFLIWIFVVSSQLLLVSWLASKILPGKRGDFIMELPPLRIPKWDNVLRKTYYKVIWFFKEALPLFVLGTFVISVADIVGALDVIINGLKPIVDSWLGLPKETSVFFILGFLRRDFGAVGLLEMADQLLFRQLLVATVAITLFVPCVANLLMIFKERGWKTAVAILVFIIPFALFVAGVLNHLIVLLGGLL